MKWHIFLLVIIGLVNIYFYRMFFSPQALTFSDGAKMAEIARNLIDYGAYGSFFSSFGADKNILNHLDLNLFPRLDRQPLMPLSIAVFFKIFGASDVSVMLTSLIYYLFTVVCLYILGTKLKDKNVGLILALAFLFIPNFWEYAINGASETLFAFQIVLSFLLLINENKNFKFLGIAVAALSYFTRPQGFILASGAVLYYLLLTEAKTKRALFKFLILAVIYLIIDLFVFTKITGKTFFYSILSKGSNVSVLYTTASPGTEGLRENVDVQNILLNNTSVVVKKLFYNIYNMYKLIPTTMSPYIFAFFALSIFVKSKNNYLEKLKYVTFYMFLTVLVTTSLSIPFIRYFHPFLTLIYLISIVCISNIIVPFNSKNASNYILISLISIFVIFQGIGMLTLDSRFNLDRVNVTKKPIYQLFSENLKLQTDPDDVITTNLDTWGSWYGERRTVWLPTTPEVIEGSGFDAIYLTSYKIDDENYYLSSEWRTIFENPNNSNKWQCGGCDYIADNYKLQNEITINPDETYEREAGKAILLVRNTH